MQARGPLMVEHRVIEEVIRSMHHELARIETTERVDAAFIDTCVDFLRTYAGRTHHGKEEEIFFRELGRRSLAGQDRSLMDELIREHAIGHETTEALAAARRLHRDGDAGSRAAILDALRRLTELYPRHIAKEDQVFFPAASVYFTDVEEQAMLAEYQTFDAAMIHEKYRALARHLGSGERTKRDGAVGGVDLQTRRQ
jgi:hemerythrin-like domain-containing protein